MGASIEELLADVAGDNVEARLAAYQAVLDKQNEGDNFFSKELDVGQFVIIACLDGESENTELATKALKCLGYFLHHPLCVQCISDEVAGTVLHKLVDLAVSAKDKMRCNYAMWCIAVQQFNASVVALDAESLVGAIVQAINNPMGSLSVTYEAIQALTTIRRIVPSKARELSHVWAPPIYKSLVADDRRERELAQNALTDLSDCIYAPSPALSEGVSTDINQSLLTKMKTMITNDQAFAAINAWKHYVRLLGDHLATYTSLVNAMLKIPEITLMSKDLNVRIASQVAWESFIDALVPQQSLWGSMSDNVKAKRLKLLLMPTVSALEFENDAAAKAQLLKTWGHLLTKLGSCLDEPVVFEAAVISVLEIIIRAGPVKDPYIWRNAMVLMERLVGAKCLLLPDLTKLDFNEEYQALLPAVDLVIGDVTVNCRAWDFRQLESILRAVEILWEYGTSHLQADTQSTPGKASMGAATRIWTLVVRAVNDYQQGTVTPSSHQISTVHLLLKFISTACKPDVNRSRGREWTIWCWRMISIVVDELGPLALASSFYIIRAPWQDFSQPASLGIFPATLLIFVWLKLSCYEEFDAQRLQRLVCASFSGLDISGSLQGILSTFDALTCYKSPEQVLSLSWTVVADELNNQMETTNNIPWSGTFGFSAVFGLLLFPLKLYHGTATTRRGDVDFKLVSLSWNRLHDTAIRICMLKGGHCTSFLGSLYHRIWKAIEDIKTMGQQLGELVGPGVVFALNHVQVPNLAEYMLNKKRKGIHHRADDASNAKGLLSVAARLLCVPAQVSLLPERLLVASAGFVKRLSRQQDALMLLTVLEEPLVFWFKLGLQLSVSLVEKLQGLWSSLLSCLQACQPPLPFDSKLLKLQARTLKLAFCHPFSPIPNTTLSFWEATYAKRATTLIYPASLLRVIQKLKASARITVPNSSSARTEADDLESQKTSLSPSSTPDTPPADEQRPNTAELPPRKRVKLTRSIGKEEAGDEYVVISSKEVKDRPLTEHQKEVRELQRREGPGVKTYTTADFSQGDALDDSDEQAHMLPAVELVNQAFAADFSAPRSLEVVMDDDADLPVAEEIATLKLSRGKRTYPMTGDQVKAYVSEAPSPSRKAAEEVDRKAALSSLQALASCSCWDRLGVDELLKAKRLVKLIQDKLAAAAAAAQTNGSSELV